jgi:hypothetical protein
MLTLTVNNEMIEKWRLFFLRLLTERLVVVLSVVLSVIAIAYSYSHGYITAYGDAESHLNIAKRVIDSLTPGFAQLGGIWLPLPHLLMLPLVKIDFLWRSGLAGSVISGLAFIVSSLFVYKLARLLTRNRAASFVAALVFMSNPNVLYLQTTPMTEMVLIVFFTLSSYFFIKFLENDRDLLSLIFAAFFGFCAALSRYDGWFLVAAEAGVLALMYLPWASLPKSWGQLKKNFNRKRWEKLQGRVILFSSLAFLGIVIWLFWDFLILGDPLYFTHSEFSAKSQQQSWLVRGELPAYRNLPLSLIYYFVTSMSNVGVIIFILALLGLGFLLGNKKSRHRYFVALILLVPFVFNTLTLYLGQSVIFIPHLTPVHFEWRMFNVRYGVMMVPLAAIAAAFLFNRARAAGKALIGILFVLQLALYGIGYSKVVSMEDGVRGLSSGAAKLPDAQFWLAREYDQGLVIVDDFARTMSIIRTKIPMQNVIYVGNKPYWQETLEAPEKHATWVVMQKDDALWRNFAPGSEKEGHLYKYFAKVYTSPEILIFKRNDVKVAGQ